MISKAADMGKSFLQLFPESETSKSFMKISEKIRELLKLQ